MSRDEPPKYVTNEVNDRRIRRGALIFLAIGWAIAYWVWPDGITDLTFAQITLGGFLRVLASAAIALGAAFVTVTLCI